MKHRPGFARLCVWPTGEVQLQFVDRCVEGIGAHHDDRDSSATYVIEANELVHLDLPELTHDVADATIAFVRRHAEFADRDRQWNAK